MSFEIEVPASPIAMFRAPNPNFKNGKPLLPADCDNIIEDDKANIKNIFFIFFYLNLHVNLN